MVAANHGGPWCYDSFVTIVFAGGTIEQKRIYREVNPMNIATTLAAIIGTWQLPFKGGISEAAGSVSETVKKISRRRG